MYGAKTDCFAFNDEKKRCNCLKKLYCMIGKGACSFYEKKENVDLLAIEESCKHYFVIREVKEND